MHPCRPSPPLRMVRACRAATRMRFPNIAHGPRSQGVGAPGAGRRACITLVRGVSSAQGVASRSSSTPQRRTARPSQRQRRNRVVHSLVMMISGHAALLLSAHVKGGGSIDARGRLPQGQRRRAPAHPMLPSLEIMPTSTVLSPTRHDSSCGTGRAMACRPARACPPERVGRGWDANRGAQRTRVSEARLSATSGPRWRSLTGATVVAGRRLRRRMSDPVSRASD